jgi:hypothetical protein
MASGSLSFRCDSVTLETVRSCSLSCLVHRQPLPFPRQPWVLHAHQLPLGSSPNNTVLGKVCSDTICNISDDFKHCTNQHESFQLVLSSVTSLPIYFPVGHPSKDYSKSSTLNCGVLMEWATKKKMHLVDIGSTKQFL